MGDRAVLGVGEFRAALPSILKRVEESGEPVLVGAHRRPVAALVPAAAVLEPARPSDEAANLPAILELLRLSPEQRLDGLVRGASFFAAARRV